MLTSTPCTLCAGTAYYTVHDLRWRRVLRCAGCGLVRADPLPSLAEKQAIETQGYTDETAYPEMRQILDTHVAGVASTTEIRGVTMARSVGISRQHKRG